MGPDAKIEIQLLKARGFEEEPLNEDGGMESDSEDGDGLGAAGSGTA